MEGNSAHLRHFDEADTVKMSTINNDLANKLFSPGIILSSVSV